MNQLSKYLKPEEIKEIQAKGSEFIDKFEQQQRNQLYKDANFLYNRTQLKQMIKGVEKYPNPLNVNDWDSNEVINHALEEMVDLSHYITLMKYKLDQLEREKEEAISQAIYWKDKYQNTFKVGE
jgi:sRNA-binding regulator protein Hfq